MLCVVYMSWEAVAWRILSGLMQPNQLGLLLTALSDSGTAHADLDTPCWLPFGDKFVACGCAGQPQQSLFTASPCFLFCVLIEHTW